MRFTDAHDESRFHLENMYVLCLHILSMQKYIQIETYAYWSLMCNDINIQRV